MNNKHVTGLAVVSIADGTKLGSVGEIYLDPNDRRVVGFTLHTTEGGQADQLIDAADVHSLGTDALMLDDSTKVHGEAPRAADRGLVTLADLIKRKVVTEDGTYVGQVASVEFNDGDLQFDQIEVSPGFFKSNKHIPSNLVTSLSGDIIVVADAVCGDSTPESIETA